MPTKKKPAGRKASESPSSPYGGERELIVIMQPEVALRASHRKVVSAAGADVASLGKVLAKEDITLTPLFGPSEERVLRSMAKTPGAPVEEMSRFYRVEAGDERLEALAEQLGEQSQVEAAYIKPAAEPAARINDMAPLPADAPPVTPDFTARQLYLEVAPGGIDARFAWTRPGGAGAGVRIIDIEGEWRFSHEDLMQNQGGMVGGTAPNLLNWRNHGTAVIGEFGGDRNATGVTGIAPDANTRAISIFGAGSSTAGAIRRAADLLSAGDIILIELHRPGPRFNFQSRDDQRGFIAIEWWPDDLAAIRYATGRGVIVIEAAGNGAENLDDAIYDTRPAFFPNTWVNPFRRTQDSGAVIVGAGAPPPGTHGRDHGPDRSRLDFSNHGANVDVQGWGREVTTCGYGDLQGGDNEDLWYTDTFSGTSSASPIVVGAVAAMQGALRAAARPLLTPATARQILRTTGSPQQDAPGRPATQRIGNRPNLRVAFTQLGLVKLKETTKEKVEVKENRKAEIKEQKEIAKDTKDAAKEGKEGKEFKELKEFVKERKEFKEKDKDIFENFSDFLRRLVRPTGAPGAPGAAEAPGSLEERVAGLEQTLATLSHFISPELRPDLATSALNQESDLQALSAQLQQQAQAAKDAKDQKDVEKLSEV